MSHLFTFAVVDANVYVRLPIASQDELNSVLESLAALFGDWSIAIV
jgi:hypothetical protein